MQANNKFLVFDWDGTLSDSISIIVSCIRDACIHTGLPDPGEEKSRYIIGMGLDIGLKIILPDNVTKEQIVKMRKAYRDLWLKRSQEVKLFEGARELIYELYSTKVPLTVATGKSRAGLERAFEKTGLKPYFVASRCADETTPKPAPDMVLELAETVNQSPQNALVIGDTSHDMQMANAAGASGVYVPWGAHSPDKLNGIPVLKIVSSMQELRDFLLDWVSK
ncbi:MAG: HAD family hydrolase [Candidatus Hydrogenedentota bacterium]|nr:MAG: HAD family hydrolase [Candidatus Hydrogenedentota bacterium]